MVVLLDENTRVVVQGITGKQGRFHTQAMLAYGTKIVAGVSPGHDGEMVHGVRVYDTLTKVCNDHEIDASILFVPAPHVKSACMEAIKAGIKLIVIITEHVPVWDAGWLIDEADQRGITIIGPNCPGLISPGKAKLGIIPGHICVPGTIGIVSRSGTLTYEVIQQLTKAGLGQSTCIGIGGDPIHGIGFIEAVDLFEKDPNTSAIVVIGEIGGDEEERVAQHIQNHITKPVVAFIAGRTAPPGKQMGHAGAIIGGESGTATTKIAALNAAGVSIANLPSEIPSSLKEKLKKKH
jgi:succinyl-CoA synthetase alpha subunit